MFCACAAGATAAAATAIIANDNARSALTLIKTSSSRLFDPSRAPEELYPLELAIHARYPTP
jgi:hypothetical protein